MDEHKEYKEYERVFAMFIGAPEEEVASSLRDEIMKLHKKEPKEIFLGMLDARQNIEYHRFNGSPIASEFTTSIIDILINKIAKDQSYDLQAFKEQSIKDFKKTKGIPNYLTIAEAGLGMDGK